MLKLRERFKVGQLYRLPSGRHVEVLHVKHVNITCRYLPDGSGARPEETMLTRHYLTKHARLVLSVPKPVERQMDLFKGAA